MKVSVIVPSFNHRQYVAETISSILDQDYPDFELIVLDDGSTDGSRELLKDLSERLGFKLILKENEGICATLNRGLDLASGELITFIASDDVMTPSRLSQQVEFLASHPQVHVVAGAVSFIDREGKILSTRLPKVLGAVPFEQMLQRNLVFAPTAMLRKEVFSRHGRYPRSYVFEDYYMWLKLLKEGGVIFNSSNIWAKYRINEANFEKRFTWYHKGYIQVLSDYLPDQRVEKRLAKYQFIFCSKLTLLLGREAFRKYSVEFERLSFVERSLLAIVSLIPSFIRLKVLHFLIRNY